MVMKLNAALSIVAFLVVASPVLSADGDDLQGTWIIQSINGEIDGDQDTPITFSGDRYALGEDTKGARGSYKTDNSKSPKHIDFTLKFDGGSWTTLAIYKISGDMLTTCSRGSRSEYMELAGEKVIIPKPRPTSFDSERGVLMVLKRKKDEKD